MDTFIVDTLKIYFKAEISNQVLYRDNEIIVILTNGTKARITAKQLSKKI